MQIEGVRVLKCPYCGEENLIDARFCSSCGKPLSDEVPSYMFEKDETLMDHLKKVVDAIEKSITEKDYREILKDRKNPITNMLIVFAAWLLLRFVGIIPFLILIRILAFLMGYSGLLFLLVMSYIYTVHQEEIHKEMERLKNIDYKDKIRQILDQFEKEEPMQDEA